MEYNQSKRSQRCNQILFNSGDMIQMKSTNNSRIRIAFIVDGDYKIGLGHIYRCITLANYFKRKFDIRIFLRKQRILGIKLIQNSGLEFRTYSKINELFYALNIFKPKIVINDILDTKIKYIKGLKSKSYFVVNFEDLGPGRFFGDLTINALYEGNENATNEYTGFLYECLRNDFYNVPKKVITDVKNILITYGGTDPNNLTLRSLKAFKELNNKKIRLTIILGFGYTRPSAINQILNQMKKNGFNINVKCNITNMPKEITNADIILTSNGRTIYEIASIGTPCISISQNEREAKHLFVVKSKAIYYLGNQKDVKSACIAKAIRFLIDNKKIRKQFNKKMLQYNIRSGLERVANLIINKYFSSLQTNKKR